MRSIEGKRTEKSVSTMINTDLISRKEAVSRISDLIVLELRCERIPTWNEVYKALNELPTVDAVPVVHGRWIKMTGMMPPEYHGHYECSECQWHMKGLRNSWTREEELSYCPNCGAKMDGDRRDDE